MHVHLNCAASLDGRIARPGGAPVVLSGPEDLRRVHLLRSEVDGVLVGVGTVLADDPSLLVRPDVAGLDAATVRQPARVVLDSRLRTPPSARVLDGRAPCFVVCAEAAESRALPGADVLVAGKARVDLKDALAALEARGIRRLLVEGGGTVLGSFLEQDLWDAFTVYLAPVMLGADGVPLAVLEGDVAMTEPDSERLGKGVLLTFARDAAAGK